MLEIRYRLACLRLAALSDPMQWTGRDLADVFALVTPALPFEEWAARVGGGAAQAPQEPAQECPAPLLVTEDESADALAALIEGRAGADMAAIGCLKIEERPAE